MEVGIILKGIGFGGSDRTPEARTATVMFEVQSEDVGSIELNIDVVPLEGDPEGIDGAVMIAKRTLIEFGKALAAAGEAYQPPMIYSLTD